MAQFRILAVDDDLEIRSLYQTVLCREGYDLAFANTGKDGLQKAQRENFDLILLDVGLPDMDGWEVCKRLKNDSRLKGVPVLMVTGKGEESDVVTGLELGADDYVTKPFQPRVLIARVRTALRRKRTSSSNQTEEPLSLGDLKIHPGRFEVRMKEKLLSLTRTEFKILYILAQNAGWVLNRDRLIASVHGEGHPITDRTIDAQIMSLRKKLGPAGKKLETVRGIGYRLKEA